MTFLPIVDRELRVAARGRFTFWSRLVAATFALLIFCALQLIAQSFGGMFSAGQVEFAILRWLAFTFACSAGLFLTSDSLSEEKREGTLGLLFLTDLRGYDVVFGKLLTQSLRAFYGLLAAFPIMGLSLLAGGVTGGEFWRAILVICNTLFLSLSLGMLVSSLSRDSTKALNATLLLGFLILAGLPFADSVLAGFDRTKFQAVFSLASPGYLFANTGASRFGAYWICLLLQNALAWGLLAVASWRAPRNWQDKSSSTVASRPGFFQRWRFGGPRARLALRRRLLARDPLLWLALRDRWLPRLVWTLAAVVFLAGFASFALDYRDLQNTTFSPAAGTSGGTVIYSSTNSSTHSTSTTVVRTSSRGIFLSPPQASPALVAFNAIMSTLEALLRLALYLWVAAQASRFFVDAVRNGAMELMLVTPVNPAQIVRGQWSALWRTFLFPLVCLVLLQLAGIPLTLLQMKSQMALSSASAGAVSNQLNYSVYLGTEVVFGVFTFIAGLAAVAWYGMWMGLTNRKTSVALLKTICFVVVLPWIALAFARIFITILMIPAGLMSNTTVMLVLPAFVMLVLNLGKDAFFIWWAHLSLRVHFREEITKDRRSYPAPTAPSSRPPPPISPSALPPVADAV